MNVNDIGVLIGLILPIFLAIAGYSMAKKRNRRGWLWFINCLLTGLIGIIVLACSNSLEYDEELDYTEEETLGWVMLFISLFWFGLNFWYGWSLADSYHDKMFWNLHNSIIR